VERLESLLAPGDRLSIPILPFDRPTVAIYAFRTRPDVSSEPLRTTDARRSPIGLRWVAQMKRTKNGHGGNLR
jgi:hypothetical protein